MPSETVNPESAARPDAERVFVAVLVSDEPIQPERVHDLVGDGVVVMLARDRRAVSRLLLGTDGAGDSPEELTASGVRVDLRRHEASCRGDRMNLSESEFRLLSTLMSDGERAFPYGELETAVWRCSFLGDPARLRSAVKRLRAKLVAVSAGVDIEAVRGLGFRLKRGKC
ncbi:MAG TPA: winged helix-turn-helix domain-containing protein [Actinomycetota bacterium]|nr:winged helix-turn-helix domain-containing protein [Actinomycetota bacterium]